MAAVELLLDLGGLSALAGTGGTDEDHADLLGGGDGLAAELAGLEGLDATLEGGNDIAEALNFVVEEAHFGCVVRLLGRSGDVLWLEEETWVEEGGEAREGRKKRGERSKREEEGKVGKGNDLKINQPEQNGHGTREQKTGVNGLRVPLLVVRFGSR